MIPFLVVIVVAEAVALGLALFAGPNKGLVVSAFLGAFFPFLFLVAWDHVKRISERRVKANNAMVEIEHAVNAITCIADKNAVMLRGAIERAKESISDGVLRISVLQLREIPLVPNAAILDLLSSELINSSFILNMDIATINSDSAKFEHVYEKTVMSKDGDSLSQDQVQNLKFHYQQSLVGKIQIHEGVLGILEQCLTVQSITRVLMRRSRKYMSVAKRLRFVPDSNWPEEIKKERSALKQEIRKTRGQPTLFELGKHSDREFWVEDPGPPAEEEEGASK